MQGVTCILENVENLFRFVHVSVLPSIFLFSSVPAHRKPVRLLTWILAKCHSCHQTTPFRWYHETFNSLFRRLFVLLFSQLSGTRSCPCPFARVLIHLNACFLVRLRIHRFRPPYAHKFIHVFSLSLSVYLRFRPCSCSFIYVFFQLPVVCLLSNTSWNLLTLILRGIP